MKCLTNLLEASEWVREIEPMINRQANFFYFYFPPYLPYDTYDQPKLLLAFENPKIVPSKNDQVPTP